MLQQIHTKDPRTINAAIQAYRAGRGPKVVAIIPAFGTAEVFAARSEGGRLQVQLERQGQWHNTQPEACYLDVPDA